MAKESLGGGGGVEGEKGVVVENRPGVAPPGASEAVPPLMGGLGGAIVEDGDFLSGHGPGRAETFEDGLHEGPCLSNCFFKGWPSGDSMRMAWEKTPPLLW